MDLSIIIINYNNEKWLKVCIRSLYKTIKDLKYEIILIDNNSQDNSVKMIKENFPKVKLIANKTNNGFGKANNQGIKISLGKYISFINDDMDILPDAINSMVDFLEKNKQAGAVCAKLLNPDKTLQFYINPYPFPTQLILKNLPSKIHKKHWQEYITKDNEPKEIDYASGAASIFKREVLNQTGLWDEQYFMFAEELDLGFRVRKNNWKVYYLPSSQIIHFGGKASIKNEDKKIRLKFKKMAFSNMMLFYKKNLGIFPLLVFKSLNLIKLIPKSFIKENRELIKEIFKPLEVNSKIPKL